MMQPIPMGIGETGPSPRPRGPFEPRHAAPEPKPPARAAPRSHPAATAVACIIMASAIAGAAGTAARGWPVGAVAAGTTLIGLLWVLATWQALKRYTAMPEPPCLHAVLGRTEGNVARACCNAARCPLLHPEDSR